MNTSEKSKVSFMEKGRVMVPFFVAALLVGAGFAQAQFVGPPGPAPTCPAGQPGCDAPINVGSGSQRKTGEVYFASTTFSSLGKSVSVGGGQVISGDMIWAKSGLFGSDAPTVFKNRVTIVPSGTADIDVPAQVVGASFNIATPNAGFLPPRVTDPTTISSAFTDGAKKLAAKGLLVHNSTTNKLQQWDGTAWVDVSGAAAAPASPSQVGPSFRVVPSGQTLSSTLSTLGIGSEDFDLPSPGAFASNKFTPKYPGQYLLLVNLSYSGQGPSTFPGSFFPTINFTKTVSATDSTEKETIIALPTRSTPPNTQFGQPTYYYLDAGSFSGSVIVTVTTAEADLNNDGSSANDVMYSVRVKNNSSLVVTSTNSYFAGTRVGSPLTVITQEPDSYTINAVAPKNAVMFFDADACPTNWGEYTNLRGRYVVGLPSGGTRGGIPAGTTALTDLENRAAGEHTHPYNQSEPSSNFPTDKTGQAFNRYSTNNTGGVNNVTGQTNNIAGTNAPYVQLLACKKLVD